MAEALLLYDGDSRENSENDCSVPISEFPSNITSVENEAVIAAPTKSLKVSRDLQKIVKKLVWKAR